jgi:hypothetical protein
MSEDRPQLSPSGDRDRSAPRFEVVRHGFDPDQVLEHLRGMDQRQRDLERRLRAAIDDLAEARRATEAAAADQPGSIEAASARVMELIRGFEQETERQRRRAELEATGIVAEARTDAARARMEAQAVEEEARNRSRRVLEEAEQEAARVRAELAPLRETTLREFRAIRDRMRISLQELDAVLPDDADRRVIVIDEGALAPTPPAPAPDPPSST